MEKIKMKKTIVLLAIGILVTGTAFAEPTFSGNFGIHYLWNFEDGFSTEGVDGGSEAAELNLKLATDYVDLALRGVAANGGDVDATADVKVNKVLESLVDLPFALTAHVGNQALAAKSVYTDPTGDISDNYWFASSDGATRDNLPFAFTADYQDLVSVYAGADVISKDLGAAVVVKPVDGVSASLSYIENAKSFSGDTSSSYAQGMLASATADIAALAALDFNLALSGYGRFYLGDETVPTGAPSLADPNAYRVALTGGKDAISAYAEYTNEAKVNNAYVGLGYDLTDDVNVSAGLAFEDLSDTAVGGNVKVAYSVAGFDTYLKYAYDGAQTGAKASTLSTGMNFSF